MGDNKKVRKRTSAEGSSGSTPKKDGSKASKAGKGKNKAAATTQVRAGAKSTWFGSVALSIFWFFVPVLVFALLWWALKPQVDAVMAGYVVPAIHTLVLPIFPKLTPAAAPQQ